MRLVELKVNNFRGVHSLQLLLDGLTVLIGENNIGKSTVLEAIRLVLTRGFGVRRGGQFSEYDFHLKDAAATAETLRDGWLCSGDLGSLDERGLLSITGRKKEIIITSGGRTSRRATSRRR